MNKPMEVLLIEPDVVLRQLYAIKLSKTYLVHSVSSAQEAIDKLDNPKNNIAIIVLDIKLGANNGVEMIYEIRSYDDWLAIPIIILSSIPLSTIPKQSLVKYGVRQFLYKPSTIPSDLKRSIDMILGGAVGNEISH